MLQTINNTQDNIKKLSCQAYIENRDIVVYRYKKKTACKVYAVLLIGVY